jgi:hypothetical protein
MENKGLLFIPDISGFSRFVSETEIEHSRMIIQELLEILINANNLGLEISEIEGDAILFYKFGDPPKLEELYKQVEDMFCAFHKNLISYELRKYCQCKACMSAIDLSLKVITHYGEFTGYNVKTFNKLIGKDIIIAHQLLKNDIDNHEYWLVTQNLMQGHQPDDFAARMKWNMGDKQTETGKVAFRYTQLTHLKNALPPGMPPQPELGKKTKMISVTREYETDIITLFHAAGDFNYRSRWMEEVERVEEVHHYLPRVGMRCRCIFRNGEVSEYTSSYYRYQPDLIEFIETDKKTKSATCFTLQKADAGKTRLILDHYIEKGLPREIIFRLSEKKKFEANLEKSLQNLVALVKEIRLPVTTNN